MEGAHMDARKVLYDLAMTIAGACIGIGLLYLLVVVA